MIHLADPMERARGRPPPLHRDKVPVEAEDDGE